MKESTESANVPVIVPQGAIFPEVLPVKTTMHELVEALHLLRDFTKRVAPLQDTTARHVNLPLQLWPSKSWILVPLAATNDSQEFVRR